jgi:predicted RNA-binding protein with PUA-like domain
MKSWLITIPKTIKWEDYEQEIAAVADGDLVMNYKTRYFPKDMEVGDRCYLLWNGRVRGWMKIVGMEEFSQPWQCQTSGQTWAAGKYIQRSGVFHKIDGPKMQGFRGVRRYNG